MVRDGALHLLTMSGFGLGWLASPPTLLVSYGGTAFPLSWFTQLLRPLVKLGAQDKLRSYAGLPVVACQAGLSVVATWA